MIKKIFKKFGHFNMILILTLIYFLILPFFLAIFIIRDFGMQKKRHLTWEEREPIYINQHEHQF